MKLQLALDFADRSEAIEIVQKTSNFIDIIEVGTPLIFREGLGMVSEMKNAFPNKAVLADLKIMDAGEYETQLAIDSGADIVTVLGVAADLTIKKAVEAAQSSGKEVMVDLIEVRDIKSRCVRLQELSVDIVCVHTAFDLQATKSISFKDLLCIKDVSHIKTAVAGGITPQNIDLVLPLRPDIVVVGLGITNAPNVRRAAREIAEKLKSPRKGSK